MDFTYAGRTSIRQFKQDGTNLVSWSNESSCTGPGTKAWTYPDRAEWDIESRISVSAGGLLVGVTLLAAASTAWHPAPPSPTVVTIAADALEPEHVDVELGEVVQWRNDSPVPRVVSQETFGLFTSDIVNPVAGTYEYATQVAGTYDYRVALPAAPAGSTEPVELHGRIGVAPFSDGVVRVDGVDYIDFHWATRFLLEEWSFDVEYAWLTPEEFMALPEGVDSIDWQTLGTGLHANDGLVPIVCDGSHTVVRARLRVDQSALVSEWSPLGTGDVVCGHPPPHIVFPPPE